MEDRIRRAPSGGALAEPEGGGGAKASSHSLWVLARRLVRMLLHSDVSVCSPVAFFQRKIPFLESVG